MKKIVITIFAILACFQTVSYASTGQINGVDFKIYNNSQIIDSDLGNDLNHAYESRFYYDKETKRVEVVLPEGNINIFELGDDLAYKATFDNGMEIKEEGIFTIIQNGDFSYYYEREIGKLSKIIISNSSESTEIEEKKEIIIYIYYTSKGKINYVTDYKSNSLFFHYSDNLEVLDTLEIINGDTLSFEYTKISDLNYMTNVTVSKQEIGLLYDKDLKAFIDEDKDKHLNMNLGDTKDKTFFVYEINPEENVIINKKGEVIQYVKGLNNKLYSILDNKVYLINPKKKNKKLIFKNDKLVKSLFVSEDGTIYILDDGIKSFKDKKVKYINPNLDNLPEINIENISNFVVTPDNKLFFIEKFSKGYFIYNSDKNTTSHINTNEKIRLVLLLEDEPYFIINKENTSPLDYNPEFENKYKEKLVKIEKKVQKSELSQARRTKIVNILKRQKDKYTNSEKNKYSKEEIKFLIEKLIEIINNS